MNEGAGVIAAVAVGMWMVWMTVSPQGPLNRWANENNGKAILLIFGASILAAFVGGQFAP